MVINEEEESLAQEQMQDKESPPVLDPSPNLIEDFLPRQKSNFCLLTSRVDRQSENIGHMDGGCVHLSGVAKYHVMQKLLGSISQQKVVVKQFSVHRIIS